MLRSESIICFQNFIIQWMVKNFWEMWMWLSNCGGKNLDLNMQSWRNWGIPVDLSEISQDTFWEKFIVMFSQRAKCLRRYQITEWMKWKWKYIFSILNDDLFCEAGRKVIAKMLLCLLRDTFFSQIDKSDSNYQCVNRKQMFKGKSLADWGFFE